MISSCFFIIVEHLAYPATLLKQLLQVLSPEGVVAVAFRNALFLLQRMKFLCGEFEYEPSGIMDNTHLRFYAFGYRRCITAIKINGLSSQAEPNVSAAASQAA